MIRESPAFNSIVAPKPSTPELFNTLSQKRTFGANKPAVWKRWVWETGSLEMDGGEWFVGRALNLPLAVKVDESW